MRPKEFSDTVAKQTRSSKAAARDQVDELVRYIVRSLRQGKPVELPGVGRMISKPAGDGKEGR